jgi:hypothetical protein
MVWKILGLDQKQVYSSGNLNTRTLVPRDTRTLIVATPHIWLVNFNKFVFDFQF